MQAIIKMMNLIEHLWQLQIPSCRIVPTIIKVNHQTPKVYFYSEKQKRVLRKKQHTSQACMDFLKEKYKDGYFLVLKTANQRIISPSLILLNQVAALIQKGQYSGIILGIDLSQHLQNIYLCECKFDSKTFETKTLMHKHEGTWFCSQKEVQTNEKRRITEQALKLCGTLLMRLKVQQKCKVFNVILGTNGGLDVFWLWCNNFQWKGQHFYQIRYQWETGSLPNQTEFANTAKKPQKVRQQTQREEVKSVFKGETQKPWLKEQSEKSSIKFQQQKCKGCDNLTAKSETKQIIFDQVVSLRRKNKLSIVGFNQEYGLVCEKCYFKLEEMSNDL